MQKRSEPSPRYQFVACNQKQGVGRQLLISSGRSHRPLNTRPRTTVHYRRARRNLDRHPNDILAAFMASAT
jgi:hypothetical protein